MKTALRIASYVLVLVIGLAIGSYYGWRYFEARSFAFDMAETLHYSEYMTTQVHEGTDASLEQAIQAYLAQIGKRKDHTNTLITSKVLATDAALSNARLAALAQKRGANEEAQQYLARAEALCPHMGWKECSIEKINNMVLLLDKQGRFKTGSSK